MPYINIYKSSALREITINIYTLDELKTFNYLGSTNTVLSSRNCNVVTNFRNVTAR